jgi:hypothetical protein
MPESTRARLLLPDTGRLGIDVNYAPHGYPGPRKSTLRAGGRLLERAETTLALQNPPNTSHRPKVA